MSIWKKTQERKCLKKKVYDTLELAETKAEFYYKNMGTHSKPYKCGICQKYHLTSSKGK